jgi:translation initiation factor 6 (eIF-6)
MKATVQASNNDGVYSARTENNVLIASTIESDDKLALGDELEVDLPSLLDSQRITKVKDRRIVRIKLRQHDIHDLDLPANHRPSRIPSLERMKR